MHEGTGAVREKGKEGVQVDEEDAWLLRTYTWGLHSNGYVRTSIGKKQIYLHHCIVGVPLYLGMEVDHENWNKLDNRRANLSIVTKLLNQNNIDRSTRRYITYRPERGTYVVQMRMMGKKTYRVCHSLEEAMETRDACICEANNRYNTARIRLHEAHGPQHLPSVGPYKV
jgi:hypothetical protein